MKEEFEEIYLKYKQEIFLFLLKLVNFNSNLAEELTQETFYQTFISLHRFRGECEIKTWICRIAKNVSFQYYRKNPIHMSVDGDEYHERMMLDVSKSPEDYLAERNISQFILQNIQSLKSKYKDVLVYRLYFDMPFNQIGVTMHISENSAKVIYYRGKELLKKRLEVYLNE